MNVPLNDFFGLKPTVQIEWPEMTLTVPTNYPSSSAYVSARVKIKGEAIIIKAKYVLTRKPGTMTFNLSKLGLAKEKAPFAKAFWVNPDGTMTELALKKTDSK